MFRSRKNLAPRLSSRRSHRQAFTLVELLVSVGIFALMTALVVVKYGSFNNSLLLTNTAYDVALVIRTAQTYGTSVRYQERSGIEDFDGRYSLDFSIYDSQNPVCSDISNSSVFNLVYSPRNTTCPQDSISEYTLRNGVVFSSFCIGAGPSDCSDPTKKPFTSRLSILFIRPDPDAHIRSLVEICTISAGQLFPNGTPVAPPGLGCQPPAYNVEQNFARITLMAPDGATRAVDVYKNGQITVQ